MRFGCGSGRIQTMITEQDLEKTILEKYKDQIELNSRLIDLVDTAFEEIHKKKIDFGGLNCFEGVLLVLFARCRKQFKAVQVLCGKGYGEDAGLILRSMINALIDISYIKTDPIRLSERYLRFDFIIRKKKLGITIF